MFHSRWSQGASQSLLDERVRALFIEPSTRVLIPFKSDLLAHQADLPRDPQPPRHLSRGFSFKLKMDVTQLPFIPGSAFDQ
jgi:hypothetical protein